MTRLDPHLGDIRKGRAGGRPFLDRFAALAAEMDAAYNAVAADRGFTCSGCPDNCCLSLFYHHTLVEYLYLYEAFQLLDPAMRRDIRDRARTADSVLSSAEAAGRSMRVPCPLLFDGRCLAYSNRPMICRLHGIPHELHRPDGTVVEGPGCDAFHRSRRSGHETRLDRTPIYREMTRLEGALRETLGYRGRIKMTIARMVLTFSVDDDLADASNRIDCPSLPGAGEPHAKN